MASAEIDRLLDQIRIRVPGVVDSVVLLEMFSMLKEFCNETNIWRERIAFNVEPFEAIIAVDPEPATFIVSPIQGSPTRLLAVVDENGRPVPAAMQVPGRVVLGRSPMCEAVYQAHLALTISDPVGVDRIPIFPNWIVTKYHNDLMDGIIGRLMSQPAKPYSSPAMATFHMKKFRTAISRARNEANKFNTYGAQPWRFPRATR